jgi:hypothetical protein
MEDIRAMKTSPEGVDAYERTTMVGDLEAHGFYIAPIPATVEAGVVERLILAAAEVVNFTTQDATGNWIITGDGEQRICDLADAVSALTPLPSSPVSGGEEE